ncbi:hypothetical protein V8F33_009456 [Rhypophila sp. PSN 637]
MAFLKNRDLLLEYDIPPDVDGLDKVVGIVQDIGSILEIEPVQNETLTPENGLTQTLCDYALVMTLERSALDRSERPYDSVRKILDDGANPNFVAARREPYLHTLSPLSLALLSRRPDIFQLLIAKGANFNGPPITMTSKLNSTYLPLHVPACAAALAIAEGTGDDLSLMQLYLYHGADLKARVPFVRNIAGDMKVVSFITPLAIYLDRAISDWTEKPRPDSGDEATHSSGDPSHVDKVSFLLTNGARSPDLVLPMEPNPGEIQCEGPYQFQPPESRFPRLVELWHAPVNAGAKPCDDIQSVLKLLVRHEPYDPKVTDTLLEYHDSLRRRELVIPIKRQLRGERQETYKIWFWKDIVDSMLEKSDLGFDVNQFLWDYIFEIGQTRRNNDGKFSGGNENVWKKVIFGQTVHALIKAGADINYQSLVGNRREKATIGATPLQALCYMYRGTAVGESSPSSEQYGRPLWELRPHSVAILQIIVDEFQADPTLKFKGSSPISMIRTIWNHADDDDLMVKRCAAKALEVLEKPQAAFWKGVTKSMTADKRVAAMLKRFKNRCRQLYNTQHGRIDPRFEKELVRVYNSVLNEEFWPRVTDEVLDDWKKGGLLDQKLEELEPLVHQRLKGKWAKVQAASA